MENEQYETITQTIQEGHKEMEQRQNAFDIIFPITLIFIGVVFVFVIAMLISPKFRGKMMSRQIRSLKHMADYSKDDIEELGSTLGGVSARTKKRILDENEDILTETAQREADIKKGYVKTMAKAVKDGFSGETVYCKHCGSPIDEDSTFCKKCGKKQ